MASAPASLTSLSNELQLLVAAQLGQGDVRSWSSTSSFYRSLFSQQIFKTLTLNNVEESALTVAGVANGRYGDCVKRFVFRVALPPNKVSSATQEIDNPVVEEPNASKEIFAGGVQNILACLNQFRTLHTLVIDFEPLAALSMEGHESGESEEIQTSMLHNDLLEAEATTTWRTLMAETYTTIVRAAHPGVKGLELLQMPSVASSMSEDSKFRSFLGSLETFNLSLCAGPRSSLKALSRQRLCHYLVFVLQLDHMYFNWLTRVKQLRFQAHERLIVGSHPPVYSFPTLGRQMRSLSRLELHHAMVCRSVVNSITSRLETLQEITMRNCYSSGYYSHPCLHDPGAYWHEMLREMIDTKPQALRHVEISQDDFPPEERVYGSEGPVSSQIVASQPRRIFIYADPVTPEGVFSIDENIQKVQLEEGLDQAAYDELMQIVHANAAAYKSRTGTA